jgi:D-alanyl-D-alanine carboxypeptidase/D-alanyl-D-alanine-endopeptidase (penicillin-binding protein 4)
MSRRRARAAFALSLAIASLLATRPAAQRAGEPQTLAGRIDAILARPEFKHATFGIEFYSLDTNTPVYTLNADKLFVPGSTTKLVTMGSAMQLLGTDYRFHTRVYRTGEIDGKGALHGDLVLVASGDTNLSGRLRTGDTLAFENVDHSYGGPDSHGLEGDPLRVVRELAGAVAGRGIKRIEGQVIVDASLFAEGERDGGTGFVISPIVVNDNAIDVLVAPGRDGDPATLQVSPRTAYARFVNRTTTGKAGSRYSISVEADTAHADGTHTVTLGGTMPADVKSAMFAYRVPQPSRFAEVVLAEALHERGVSASARANEEKVDSERLAKEYQADRVVAEHVSPPFSEEVKITLKVSQNLHASATPFVLGALGRGESGGASDGPSEAGFIRMRKFLETTGADVSGASQSDGAGAAAHFTPDFMVHYLAFMARQPSAAIFHDALPVLGRDGTLWNIQTTSRAAGHVYAKTGTYASQDLLHEGVLVNGKGLAGYMTTADGRHLALAIYANNVPLRDGAAVTPVVGDALGEIAAAAYDAPRVR